MSTSEAWNVTDARIFGPGENPLGNGFYGYVQRDLALPDGRNATYHGVDIRDCVHVVALEDDETTYLVRQRRPNTMHLAATAVPMTLELPGGFADRLLTPEEREQPDVIQAILERSAAAEMQQEIKREAGMLEFVGTILPSTGISNEHDHIFMATDLTSGDFAGSGEATEQDMRIVSGKFGDLYRQMQLDKRPQSGQTLAAMSKVAVRLS